MFFNAPALCTKWAHADRGCPLRWQVKWQREAVCRGWLTSGILIATAVLICVFWLGAKVPPADFHNADSHGLPAPKFRHTRTVVPQFDMTSSTDFRPTLSFRRSGDETDVSRRALRLEQMLNRLWLTGVSRENCPSVGDVIETAEAVYRAGQYGQAARLRTALARVMEALGEFNDAHGLLARALSGGEQIDSETLHEIMRLRTRLALDSGNAGAARRLVRLIERPVIVRSERTADEYENGRGVGRRQPDGEMVLENEGAPSTVTLLLQAEVEMADGDYAAARKSLDRAADRLLKTPAPERKVDDMAMLAMLRTIDPARPAAGSPEVLRDLASHWLSRSISAPTLARFKAAAGDPTAPVGISVSEYERYLRLGATARESASAVTFNAGGERPRTPAVSDSSPATLPYSNAVHRNASSVPEDEVVGNEVVFEVGQFVTAEPTAIGFIESEETDDYGRAESEAENDPSVDAPAVSLPAQSQVPDTRPLSASRALPISESLENVLSARDLAELTARVAASVEAFGGKRVLVRIMVNDTRVLASSGGGGEGQPRMRLVEDSAAGGGLRLLVEAAEALTDEAAAATSALARAARFAAETLPVQVRAEVSAAWAEAAADEEFVWASPAMFDICTLLRQIAPADGREGRDLDHVLITGERGTGKDLIARQIHKLSSRRDRELIKFNMSSAGTSEMADSNIFGHKKGAYTDAKEDSPGLIRRAEGSTLFLDEIGECSQGVQAKLLRVVEYGDYSRLGEPHKSQQADVRFILATNRDPHDHGAFRQDLLDRCVHIHVPPLRQRREDIALLARHFARMHEVEISDAAVAYLQELDFPGNVRQLGKTIKMLARESDRLVTPERVRRAWQLVNPRTKQAEPPPVQDLSLDGETVVQKVARYEVELLRLALAKCNGSVKACAEVAGMSRNGLTKKLRGYGLLPQKGGDAE